MEKIKAQMGQYLGEYIPTQKIEKRKIRQVVDYWLLGELIVEFNWLEADIERAFCELISDREHETGMMIISSMQFSQKCEILNKYIKRLFAFHDTIESQKLLQRRNDCHKTITNISEYRNKVVHWFREDQDEYWYIRTSQGKFDEQWITVQQVKILNKDLRAIIKKIESTRVKIQDVVDKCHNTR